MLGIQLAAAFIVVQIGVLCIRYCNAFAATKDTPSSLLSHPRNDRRQKRGGLNFAGSLPEDKSAWPLFMAKRSTEKLMSKPWLPEQKDEDDIFGVDENRQVLEKKAIQFLASLMEPKLKNVYGNSNEMQDEMSCSSSTFQQEQEQEQEQQPHSVCLPLQMARDRFRDLTCTLQGERNLEELFDTSRRPDVEISDLNVVKASIIALQSLAILGMQVGVKATPQQQERNVSHLISSDDVSTLTMGGIDDEKWNSFDTKYLKHKIDTAAGVQLLAELKRKRSAQSAFDVMVKLGAWTKHEDLALLRSGFPTRFTDQETQSAREAAESDHDPDEILGLRKDLRHLKVYTIDGEYTDEIDDGLSIENVVKSDGSTRKRIWVHIADAERWAPCHSDIFKAAELRVTSLYLPTGSVPMFPSELSCGKMSLRAGQDSHALSMAIELNEDGSIDRSSIFITPSLINVNYRLSYEEVDQMLEMGVGYFEEWELGALLEEANKRRKYRIECGSTEGFVPHPIPQAEVRVMDKGENEVDILLEVESTHNSGLNQSEAVLTTDTFMAETFASPVSPAFLLVTEMMILSGEAMGKLKEIFECSARRVKVKNTNLPILENTLDLPYRTQPKPDFAERYQELNTLNSLKNKGYCHAWYARRFFEPIRMKDEPLPHHGLGIECYVQWSSPIRRLCDLQVHASVKRFLRRHRVNLFMEAGRPIPDSLTAFDLGCDIPRHVTSSKNEEGIYAEYSIERNFDEAAINYKKGSGFINAARMVQKKSKEYWLFEYVRRQVEECDMEIVYETTVLACIDPRRGQYAIYVHKLGLEHRYVSEQGELKIGEKLWLKVSNVQPRLGLLTFTLSSFYGGKSLPFTPVVS
jgi:Exoribonuclease R